MIEESWWKLHYQASEVKDVYVGLSANLAIEAIAFNHLDETKRESAQEIRADTTVSAVPSE